MITMTWKHAMAIVVIALATMIWQMVEWEKRSTARRGHAAFVGKQFGFILRDYNPLGRGKVTRMLYLDDKGQWHEQEFPTEMVIDVQSQIQPQQIPTLSIDSVQQTFK